MGIDAEYRSLKQAYEILELTQLENRVIVWILDSALLHHIWGTAIFNLKSSFPSLFLFYHATFGSVLVIWPWTQSHEEVLEVLWEVLVPGPLLLHLDRGLPNVLGLLLHLLLLCWSEYGIGFNADLLRVKKFYRSGYLKAVNVLQFSQKSSQQKRFVISLELRFSCYVTSTS